MQPRRLHSPLPLLQPEPAMASSQHMGSSCQPSRRMQNRPHNLPPEHLRAATAIASDGQHFDEQRPHPVALTPGARGELWRACPHRLHGGVEVGGHSRRRHP